MCGKMVKESYYLSNVSFSNHLSNVSFSNQCGKKHELKAKLNVCKLYWQNFNRWIFGKAGQSMCDVVSELRHSDKDDLVGHGKCWLGGV